MRVRKLIRLFAVGACVVMVSDARAAVQTLPFTVTADMLQAAEGVFTAEWPKAEGAMKDVLEEEAAAFKSIADARIAGKITDEDFQRQMDDEKETLQAGLAMVRVINKKLAQDAINAVLTVFTDAVKAAISAGL